MNLSVHQRQFARMIGLLLNYLPVLSEQLGMKYEVTFGDAYSKVEFGVHSYNSKHYDRLAVDFNLFINGVYQSTTEAHEPLGNFWNSIGGTWGGDFKHKDGNHYSYLEGKRK